MERFREGGRGLGRDRGRKGRSSEGDKEVHYLCCQTYTK